MISIVIPCHNEVGNLEHLHRELLEATESTNETFEYILVDDGSTDTTRDVVAGLQAKHSNVRLIELVRNFGKEIAVSAGLHAAKGDAAITIDADLQHPPAVIPDFIEAWKNGAEVVVGVRKRSKNHAPILKRYASAIFYRLLNLISNDELKSGATDYRLLDRVVINEFNRFTERGRLTRGLIDWLGFRRAYVTFTPARRHAGEAAYSYNKLVKLAMTSVVSMSFFPLKLAGYLGVIITVLSGSLGLFILVEKYILHDPWDMNVTGTATLAVVLLFLVGIILMCLGLIALYIATIHTEVMNRPLYVARPEKKK